MAVTAKIAPLIEAFFGLARGRALAQFDWRGTGRAERRLAESLDDLLLDLGAVTDALGDPPDVVAYNAACFPAVSFAAQSPNAWRSLVLASPMVRLAGSPQGTLTRPGWEADYEGYVRSMTRFFFPSLSPAESEIVTREWMDGVPSESNAVFRSIDAAIDLTDALKRVDMPVMVWPGFPGSKAGEVARLLPNAVLADGAYSAVGPAARDGWDASIAPKLEEVPSPRAVDVKLTPRETEVLRQLAAGTQNVQIARSLSISTRTVENHIAIIYAKIGVHNRVEAANWAREHGVS